MTFRKARRILCKAKERAAWAALFCDVVSIAIRSGNRSPRRPAGLCRSTARDRSRRARPRIFPECEAGPRSRQRRDRGDDQPDAENHPAMQAEVRLVEFVKLLQPGALQMAGRPSRNEKRAASSRFRSRNMAAVSVEPERDTPGMSAPHCAMPTINASLRG